MLDGNMEINVDGLIGPSHHFGGLGVGNLASQSSRLQSSSPRAAALEGLAKMELVASLGVPQWYLPPLPRPNWGWLEQLGFAGERSDVLKRCFDFSPVLLSAAYSSAFMWTANAATVAPSSDTLDGTLRVVPANLCSNLHRGQEAAARGEQIATLLAPVSNAKVLPPLPSVMALRDEGAANHMRLCNIDRTRAVHVFVYGADLGNNGMRFIGRQSEFASRQVACALQLDPQDCMFFQQTATAINAGVFHNDVIATSHHNLLIYHEDAFEKSSSCIASLQELFHRRTGDDLKVIQVLRSEVSLQEAVSAYLFNSQLISNSSGAMELICPAQCRDATSVARLIQSWIDDASNPVEQVHFMQLNESMANGGGPACLRLRMDVTKSQLQLLGTQYRVDAVGLMRLREAVSRTYPERLHFEDLARLDFANHIEHAVKELNSIASNDSR
jgi:succinylarginine dihydrolase